MIKLEDFELDTKEKRDLGVKISKVRAQVLDQARKIQDENKSNLAEDQQYISRLDKKLLNRGEGGHEVNLKKNLIDFQEPVPPGLRKRKKWNTILTVSEKVDIVHRMLVQYDKLSEVA